MPVGARRGTVAHQRCIASSAVPTAWLKEWDMDFWSVIASIFWFMILFAWIVLLFRIFGDLFGDHELSGWGKALWTVFLIVLPWLGVLVYLIARGRSMNERALAKAQRNEQAFRQYVRDTAETSTTSTADELGKLAELRDRGTISDEEFQHAKAKLLGRQPEPASPANTDGRPVVPSTTT
jgi:Short C-terminal domain/Phospholipase_D-nuclease N-terminal